MVADTAETATGARLISALPGTSTTRKDRGARKVRCMARFVLMVSEIEIPG